MSVPLGQIRPLHQLQKDSPPPFPSIFHESKQRYQQLKYKHSHSSKTAQHDLRHSFQESLNKLNDLSTRRMASKEAKTLIENNVSQDALKIYLSALGELPKMKSPGAREQDVLLIAYISQVFGEQLILESSHPLKNIQKMLKIVQGFFKDDSKIVHEAAGVAWAMLFTHSFPKSANTEIFINTFFDPLESSMSSGVNPKAQQAASVVLLKLVLSVDSTEFFTELLLKVVPLFLRLRIGFTELIASTRLLIENTGLQPVYPETYNILNKLLLHLKCSGPSSHTYKSESCKLLQILAMKLIQLSEPVPDAFYQGILQELHSLKTHKLPIVQKSAREALAQWKILANSQQNELSLELPQGEEVLVTQQRPLPFDLAKSFDAIQRTMETQFSEINEKLLTINQQINAAAKKALPPGATRTLTATWVAVLQDIATSQYEQAYNKILATEDDIYLIRVMHKTGPVLQHLSPQTANRVLRRLAQIISSSFIADLGIDWISDAVQHNVLTMPMKPPIKSFLQKLSRGSEIASSLSLLI